MTGKQKNLIVRAITGVLFVAALVTCFLKPISMVFLFTLITGMSIWEYTGLVNENVKDVSVNRFISTAAGAFLFLGTSAFVSGMSTAEVFIPYLLTIIYLFVSELYTGNPNALADWAYTMMGQLYIAVPFSTINVLAFQNVNGYVEYQYLLPLSVFVFLWTNDTGAYCSGSLFGKHKLFPRISPAKSWEGSIGGGIFVVVVAALIGYFSYVSAAFTDPMPLTSYIAKWIGLGIVVAVFGTWGDLVESLIKRTIGIKDSGNILPGHGGMLDRFDSSLMAIPASVIYLYALQYIMH
ncbi:MAG: phosphatidate cytidylyltransferase [Bacteroidales bacterium]|nr:phosphatidate cytidylyltransferase [Bacteroidales bacterium]MCM1147905.1 phosphatidate cytidylyltransferase [Bacteroidales bacterium]MCM1205454.1 phosphatidate cytidylyltransferase [Bacillota bacterium]MCM1509284.1 phosphatidate cytidylyltransferase [Clostridium sp.]